MQNDYDRLTEMLRANCSMKSGSFYLPIILRFLFAKKFIYTLRLSHEN